MELRLSGGTCTITDGARVKVEVEPPRHRAGPRRAKDDEFRDLKRDFII